jgi:dTDP-4-amino-4,6-dideoxygalactose transaminase
VAARHGLRVLEDSAQAFGASYRGRRLGTIGDIGAFSLQFNKILTSGEGGLVMTDDQRLFERALMFHDVAAGGRAELRNLKTFVATTCRMSELQGAVALAQLGKLNGILADMRRNFSAIKDSLDDVVETKPVSWRHQWDPAGDACLAIVAYLEDAATARRVAQALCAEGIKADVMFDEAKTDFHVAYHWKPVIAGTGWSETTPWTSGGGAGIDPATCPRTHALLGRAVHVDVSPELTGQQAAQIAAGFRKVLTTLL